MKRLASCAFLTLFLLWADAAIPQDIAKFGKVSKEELQMSAPSVAPNADALYLFEVGELRISIPFLLYGGNPQHSNIIINENKFKEKLGIILEKHVRIKILTEAGVEAAKIRIPFREGEKLHDLKGIVVLPGGKKIKLRNENVLEEQIDSIKYKKLIFPILEVGSVVEYKYRLESKKWIDIVPWYFQNTEFTKLSQITLEILPFFDFLFHFENTTGIEPIVKETLMPDLHPRIYKKRELTWKKENLPGIKIDSKTGNLETQGAAIRFKLKEFRSNYGYINFLE